MPGTDILVVRLGSMGDVIHSLPAVASLRHSFPGSSLSWVIHPKWSVLLEGNPFVDGIITLDRRSTDSIRQAWRELRAKRFDFAIDFQGLIQSAIIASVARPDRIFGFHHAQVRERPAALFYSNKVRATSAHIVDRNLELAASAGATALLQRFPIPEGRPEGELPESDFVIASPLSGWAGKQWPLASYDALARRLQDELGFSLVLNGPPDSLDLFRSAPNAIAHASSIAGLIYATRKAAAVVGTDSGPLHLAAALGKPGVAVFGPTDPARNGPYGNTITVLRSENAITTYKRHPEIDLSMSEIGPDSVFEALRASIQMRRSAGQSL